MSAPETAIRDNNKVHTIYKDDKGKQLSSVTTILNSVLAKPALIRWAYGLGKAGIDMDTYRDELADIGKLAHRMILDHLSGVKTDTAHYTPEQIDLAENAFLKYLEWEKAHKVEPVLVETPLMSRVRGFGGTPDFIGYIDGVLTLMDYKTGKAIYDEAWFQLGGYSLLYEATLERAENGPLVDYRILNIGRDETERFVEECRNNIDAEREVFIHALAIHKLRAKKR